MFFTNLEKRLSPEGGGGGGGGGVCVWGWKAETESTEDRTQFPSFLLKQLWPTLPCPAPTP